MEDEVYKFLKTTIGRAMENKTFRSSVNRQLNGRNPTTLSENELFRIIYNATEEAKKESK